MKTLPQKLLAVQNKIAKAVKGSQNPHFKSQYADLNEVLEVSKAPLNEEGLVLVQAPGKDSFGQFVETSILDSESGQQATGKVYFSGNEDNMQKIGAAITYARRFGLVSILAMETEDDDGEAAVGRGVPKANQTVSRAAETKSYSPMESKVSTKSQSETLKELVQTRKVAIDMKKITYKEVSNLLTKYGAKVMEDLSADSAHKVLNELKEKINV